MFYFSLRHGSFPTPRVDRGNACVDNVLQGKNKVHPNLSVARSYVFSFFLRFRTMDLVLKNKTSAQAITGLRKLIMTK